MSENSSEAVTIDGETISVSSSFYPGAHETICDTIFRSTDGVLFFVDSKLLLGMTIQAFKPVLLASLDDKVFRDNILEIPDNSATLDIILHMFYNISPAKSNPSYQVLEASVNRMQIYGLVPSVLINSSSPFLELLLSQAPVHGIDIYALAGQHGLDDLGVKVSVHLLSYRLPDLSDELAKRMGATYLRRLLSLHAARVEELKKIILRSPHPHPPTLECDFVQQKNLSRAWALAASYLAWDSRPALKIADLSVHTIQSVFDTLGEHLDCEQCKNVLRIRVKEVVVQWVNVKRTV